ncbi:MAG: ATP-binding protein [Cytophagales bacterium]|nr:ATP-binding protein [Cytophagales bacterium]
MKFTYSITIIVLGFIFSVLIFGGALFYNFKSEYNLSQDFAETEQIHEVINLIRKITSITNELESNVRGYELTSDEIYIDGFDKNEVLVKSLLNDLEKLVKNSEYSESQFQYVKTLIDQLLFSFDKMISESKTGKKDLEILKINTNNARIIMNKIRLLENNIIDDEQSVLKRKQDITMEDLQKTHLTIQVMSITSIVLSVLILLFFMQYRRAHHRIEQGLVDLNDNKNKFFSIISHDLRGPVKNIVLMSQLLNENTDAKSYDPKKIAKMIESSSKNLSNLLDNLLKWSRIQMDKIDFRPERIEVQKLAEDIVNHLKIHAAPKSIDIVNNIPPNAYVTADLNMISTVIRNLISNAIKFTEKNGLISIYGRDIDSNTFEISIEDNGVGIPNNILAKIFSIDFKHSTKGTNKEEGTGLGLKICKEFIEKNNGTIKAESKLKEGSKFIFTLPK